MIAKRFTDHVVQFVHPLSLSQFRVRTFDLIDRPRHEEPCGDVSSQCITGNLLPNEFVVWLIFVERLDDPIAILPRRRSLAIHFIAMCLTEPYQIQPVRRPAFSVVRTGKSAFIVQQEVTLKSGEVRTINIEPAYDGARATGVHPGVEEALENFDHDQAPTANQLEKLIRMKAKALLHGRMELAIEFETLWPTNGDKPESITSLGTARWFQKPGLMRIESDRMAPKENSVKLYREQWTTGFDGSRVYSWNRTANSIRYGKLRKGALAYAPNLFFWGRSETAYAHSMFGPNPKIQQVTRDGNREWDVLVEDSVSGVSVKYVGISPVRGFLPTRVESRAGDRLQCLIELKDFFQPRADVWAAKSIHWTFWSDQDSADGNRLVTARTTFTVTRLELGDDADLDEAEFSLSLPKGTREETSELKTERTKGAGANKGGGHLKPS